MESLRKITAKFMDLIDNDELTEEQAKELGQELALELQEKGTNIISYIVDSEGLIKRIKEEEERLTAYRKSCENKLERFKTYVKDNMEILGIEKMQTELGTMSIRKCPTSVEVYDEALVPQEYLKEKITYSVDKTKIKEDYVSQGILPQGVRIITDKTTLNIK